MKQTAILPPEWTRVTVITDRTLPGADEERTVLRRVGAALAGHVVTGLLNHLDMGPIALARSGRCGWIGYARWRHQIQRPSEKLVTRRALRRAYSRFLNAYVGGRVAEMRASFGWPEEGVSLDYAAPATELIIALAERLDPFNPRRVIRGSVVLNQRIISDPTIGRAVDVLADLLIVEKRLTGEAASWLVAGVFGALNSPKQTA